MNPVERSREPIVSQGVAEKVYARILLFPQTEHVVPAGLQGVDIHKVSAHSEQTE